jgi:anti-sigma regulatory factor (Ser/Thr protein kinase)
MSKIKLPANIYNLRKLIQFVSNFSKKKGFSRKRIQEIELAVEEAFVNISKYAYPDKNTGEVEVRCQMDNDAELVIEILDTGASFDIRYFSEPDLNVNISDREIGGLGIFLIRKLVDEVHYRRDGQSNILSFIIRKND